MSTDIGAATNSVTRYPITEIMSPKDIPTAVQEVSTEVAKMKERYYGTINVSEAMEH